MNLLGMLRMNVEIRKARRKLWHYETTSEADNNINLAHSVLEKYRSKISLKYAEHFEEQIRKAEIDLKNNFILGYIV